MEPVEALYRAYRDDVYRLAVSYTRNFQEAEDVCQTVFLKLMEQRSIAPGKEKAWLMQVTANQCRSLLRSGWWKRTAPLEDGVIPAPGTSQDVLQAILSLPPKYRVVVYLHYYEGYPTAQIGRLLKISQSAVTSRLSRARESLRTLLTEV